MRKLREGGSDSESRMSPARRLVHVRRIANGTIRFADVARLNLRERERERTIRRETNCVRTSARVFRLRPTALGSGEVADLP